MCSMKRRLSFSACASPVLEYLRLIKFSFGVFIIILP